MQIILTKEILISCDRLIHTLLLMYTLNTVIVFENGESILELLQEVFHYEMELKVDRSHPHYYQYTPPDYRHTKCIITLLCQSYAVDKNMLQVK